MNELTFSLERCGVPHTLRGGPSDRPVAGMLCCSSAVVPTPAPLPAVFLLLQAITSGFFYNTSKMSKSGDYKTIKNQHTVYIHPSSVLHKQEVRTGVLFCFLLLLATAASRSTLAILQQQGYYCSIFFLGGGPRLRALRPLPRPKINEIHVNQEERYPKIVRMGFSTV